jgi:hypothetical protein
VTAKKSLNNCCSLGKYKNTFTCASCKRTNKGAGYKSSHFPILYFTIGGIYSTKLKEVRDGINKY